MSDTEIVILSVPYTEPLPMVAPALLSACLNNVGISAVGLDFSISFLDAFVNRADWNDIKHLLTLGTIPDKKLSKRTITDILKFIKKYLLTVKQTYNPNYIGLSIFTNESIDFSYILIPYIRKYLPNTKIVVGGRGIELMCGVHNIKHYEIYHKYGMADTIVVGDAETALIEVIQNNITGIYFAKQQTKEDLDDIPSPNWDDYDVDVYKKYYDYTIPKDELHPELEETRYLVISSSKGCVRKCTFCDVASFWPKYLYREGANVARDIITNYHATGIKNYLFSDNLINGSVSHYREMNKVLAAELPRTITYSGFAIFRDKKYMPEEDFVIAKEAGCARWTVGVESGSERIRFDMKKDVTDQDQEHCIINLHKNNIVQTWLLIVGYPTETEQDYLLTEDMLKRYAYLNKNGAIKLGITATFQLLHNSPLIQNQEYVKKYGLNYDVASSNLSRYFWTADINPENIFPVRADRFVRLVTLAQSLGYQFQKETPLNKIIDELQDLKLIYNDYKPKKLFTIARN